jgi:hypothetical protein
MAGSFSCHTKNGQKFVQMVVLVIHRVMLVCLLGGRLDGLMVIRKGFEEIERAKEINGLDGHDCILQHFWLGQIDDESGLIRYVRVMKW